MAVREGEEQQVGQQLDEVLHHVQVVQEVHQEEHEGWARQQRQPVALHDVLQELDPTSHQQSALVHQV